MASQLLVLGFTLLSLVSAKLPRIEFISNDVITEIGKDAEFTCTILDEQEYPVNWMRLGGNVVSISKGSELSITDKRFTLTHDKAAGSYTLKIKNVKKSDATTYQCQVMVSLDNIITRTVDVKVVESPIIKESSMVKSTKVVEGKPVQMTCEASGFPIPKISWSRMDGLLMPNGKMTLESSTLSIPEVKKEDRGSYRCSANNGIGKGQNTTLTLEVEFGPEVKAMRPRIAQAPHYEAHLTCEVLAFPPPSIIWKNGDEEIVTNDNINIAHFAKENEVIVTTLKIAQVTEDLYGKYSCLAANRHGTEWKEIELYRSSIPICPPLCGDLDLSSAPPTLRSYFYTTMLAAGAAFFL